MAETLVTSPEAREYLAESGFHQVSYAQDLRSPQDDAWLQISPTWGYYPTTMEDLLTDADHISAAQPDAVQHAWGPEQPRTPAAYESRPTTPGLNELECHDNAAPERPSPELSGKTVQLSDDVRPPNPRNETPPTRKGHRASAMKLLTTAASHVTKAFTSRKQRLDLPDNVVSSSTETSPLKIDTLLNDETATLASWDVSKATVEPEPAWLYHFRSGVSALSTVPGNGAFITPKLDLEQRIRAHAIAALWGLSHMSVGKAGAKRLIIANCQILPFCGNGGQCILPEAREGASTPRQQHQTPSRFNSSRQDGVHMDVSRICFHVDPRDEADSILAELNDQDWILPPLSRIDSLAAGQQGAKLVMASCANVETSSKIVERLGGVGHLGRVRLLHVHFPFMDGVTSICEQHGASQATIHGLDQIWRLPSLGKSADTEQPSSEQRKLRKRGHGQSPIVLGVDSPLQRLPSSAASSMHSENSMSSSIASTTRKSRQPKIKNGYQCPDCVRMFDRAAERDKHWKNVHQKDRPYQCPACAMAFLYPKDLERHMPVHT